MLTGFSIAHVGACIIALPGRNLWVLMVGYGGFFSFYLGANTSVESWRQDIIPQEARGRFFGILNIGSAISQAIGAVLAGFLADTFHNVSWVFLATAILLWASVPFYSRVQETLKKIK